MSFSDRFVIAVDAADREVGGSISLEQLRTMPYQASSCVEGTACTRTWRRRFGPAPRRSVAAEPGG